MHVVFMSNVHEYCRTIYMYIHAVLMINVCCRTIYMYIHAVLMINVCCRTLCIQHLGVMYVVELCAFSIYL